MGRELELRRFVVNPDSLKEMKALRNSFRELKIDHPYLSGIGFFGSRTKGVENLDITDKDVGESDIDFYVFYNRDRFKGSLEYGNVYSFCKRKLAARYEPHILLHDISRRNTDYLFNEFIKETIYFINGDDRELKWSPRMAIDEDFSGIELTTRFHLGIGDDLYENRKYIIDKFKNVSDGYKHFALLMDVLEATERTDYRPGMPVYRNIPKALARAEKYFTLKKPGAIPESESPYLD